MAIRTVVTRGYGNGTFNGTIPLVATRGFVAGEEIVTTEVSNLLSTLTRPVLTPLTRSPVEGHYEPSG